MSAKLLGFWLSTASVLVTGGFLQGAKTLKYTRGLHNFYPVLALPTAMIGIYGANNDNWHAYTAFALGNTMLFAHFSQMIKNEVLLHLHLRSFYPFFLATSGASLYIILNLYHKEIHTCKLNDTLKKMNDKTYQPTSYLTP